MIGHYRQICKPVLKTRFYVASPGIPLRIWTLYIAHISLSCQYTHIEANYRRKYTSTACIGMVLTSRYRQDCLLQPRIRRQSPQMQQLLILPWSVSYYYYIYRKTNAGLEFQNNLWGLRTAWEQPARQPMQPGGPVRHPSSYSMPSPHRLLKNSRTGTISKCRGFSVYSMNKTGGGRKIFLNIDNSTS